MTALRRVFGLLTQIGDHRAAALLYGALNPSGAMSALPVAPNDAHDGDALVGQLRAALGDDGFDIAVATGESLSEAELVQFVQARITAHNS